MYTAPRGTSRTEQDNPGVGTRGDKINEQVHNLARKVRKMERKLKDFALVSLSKSMVYY